MQVDLDALVGKLSLEQKVRLVTGADFWTLYPEPAIGLRAVALSDGPVGVRGTVDDERDTSANLPSPTALAASWDIDLLARLARLLAAEARRKGVDVVLGPTINLHRTPLGGRHFECYSEDPYLTAELGIAYVRAMQALGVGATPKHYVANDSETERFTVDVRADERTLRELYLRPFEEIVREADPWLVMASYNSVNGHTMTENPLLAEPLKGEWGFTGVVVSDWLATRDTVAAGRAAMDLAMPALNSPWGDDLVAAVRAGGVREQAIDEKVRRILLLAARVGALSAPALDGGVAVAAAELPEPVGADEIAALLREAGAAGTVLLRNPDGVLPLDPATLRRVAVFGPNAAQARTQGGGSATVHPAYTVSPLDGLRAALDEQAEIVHVPGTRVVTGLQTVDWELSIDPVTGRAGLRQDALDDSGQVLNTQHRRAARVASLPIEAAHAASVRMTSRLRADEAGEWHFGFTGIGAYTLRLDGETVLDETVLPEIGVDATSVFADPPQRKVARTLTAGEVVELELTYEVIPNAPMHVALGYERPELDEEAELARAAEAARAADAAIVVVGTTNQVESEGFDRANLALPGRQDDLVRAVARANPRTVVVVNAGSPVEMPWRDEVAAVLLCWFGGQEMGNALADVLLGQAEPGGRLPTTWPVAQQDVPVLVSQPVDGTLEYAEGIHIGYRAWLRAGTQPAYPFGHGLGYTTWEYEQLTVSGQVATVRLRNTGQRAGKQVVQVYAAKPESTLDRPVRWLVGFAVVHAQPGEHVTVEVPLDKRAFQYWSVEQHGWVEETGTFQVYAGQNVADTPLHTQVAR